MKFDRFSALLLGIILVLLVPTGYIAINERKHKPESQVIFSPKLNFKEKIRLPLKLEKIDPFDYLEEIVNEDGSEYDEVLELNLSLDTIGRKQGNISVSYNDLIGERNFMYEVYDDEAPEIAQSELFVTDVGTPINFLDYITVSDNSLKEGETIEAKVEGDVDFDTPGTYTVLVSAEDASENRTAYEATVTVREIYIEPEPIPNTGNESSNVPDNGGNTESPNEQPSVEEPEPDPEPELEPEPEE